ncbi:hypothetical protein N7466_000476 [Penicillium verhagenii]|uniref:uncharacterized protein n=1 Tax=Penicillium verhagenii TaxID=1562060 RepID=UPI002544E249|nr:uncharacterized protein N7466_000476 [Penicillium verhagenii]KAJ5947461.1 hypothetical protein N7466_000476 [Penicillium verhagenii]
MRSCDIQSSIPNKSELDGFTPRTVEIFRSFSVSTAIYCLKLPQDSFETQRMRVERTSTPQDQLEPLLPQRATDLGVEIRDNHEFVGLAQDAETVTVITKSKLDGSLDRITAKYLIAADGHRSTIGESLAIPWKGHGPVNSVQSVLFRAPELSPYLKRGAKQFKIDQPDLKAFMIAYENERLVLHLPNDREWTDELIKRAIIQAIGPEKVTLEIIATSRWDMSAWISDEFSRGKVFLVGDAAHSLPPTRGGYGANTGIADGHYIAWKLAQVIQGTSDAQLMASYAAERLPVAWLRHGQIFTRSDYREKERKKRKQGRKVNLK